MDDVARFIEDLKDAVRAVGELPLDAVGPGSLALAQGRAAQLRQRLLEPLGALLPQLEPVDRRHVIDGIQAVGSHLTAALALAGAEADARDVAAQLIAKLPPEAVQPALEAGARAPAALAAAHQARAFERAGDGEAAYRAAQRVRQLTREPALLALVAHVRVPLRPLDGAPPLYTLNGIGTSLHGRADERPDGSYLATLYVVFLFIPLLPLRRYLVRDAGSGGWYFLARAPLARWQRWYLGALVASVVVGCGAAVVQDHLDSPEYRIQAPLAEALSPPPGTDADQQRARLEKVLADFGEQVAPERLAPAAQKWTELTLAAWPRPCAPTSADVVQRGVRGFGAWPSGARGALSATVEEAVLRCANDIGFATPASSEAAIALLEGANRAGLAGAVAAAIKDAHLTATKLWAAAGDALQAAAHALESGNPAAIDAAADALAQQGDSGTLLLEAPDVIERFAARLEGSAKHAALARDLAAWLAAARKLDAALEEDPALDGDDVAALQAACRARPQAQLYCVRAAELHRGRGDLAAARAALALLGAEARWTTAAKVVSHTLDDGPLPERAARLEQLVANALPRFLRARAAWIQRLDGARGQLFQRARERRLPADIERELDALPSAEVGPKVHQWVQEQLDADPAIAAARATARRFMPVVDASVLLGTWRLEEASGAEGPARDEALARAERAFLAVQDEADGIPSFHLGLGQVLHRLGKQAEGDAELAKVIDGATVDLRFDVASVYRDLGQPERARPILIDLQASSDPHIADRAASLLAIYAPTLEETERWLGQVKRQSPEHQAALAEARGRRLLEADKRAEADAAFAEAQRIYAGRAKVDGAAANNAAVALMWRFGCQGDPKFVEEAGRMLKLALASHPESATVTGNLANVELDAATVTTLATAVSLKALNASTDEAEDLLELLLDGAPSLGLRAALARNRHFVEGLDLLRRHQVLAPSDPGAYLSEAAWRAVVDDRPGAGAVVRRAALAKPTPLRFDWDTAERRTASDTRDRKRVAAHATAAAKLSGRALTLSLALQCMTIRDLHQPTRSELETAVAQCRAAQRSATDVDVGRELGRTLAQLAVVEVAEATPALARALADPSRREPRLLLAWRLAQKDPGLARRLGASPTLAEAAALLGKATPAPTLSDLAVAAMASDPKARAALAQRTDDVRLGLELAHIRLRDPTATQLSSAEGLVIAALGRLPASVAPGWLPPAP